MVNFGILAAEIVSLVWGTPANFNGSRVLAALLHGTLVVGVRQILWRWTEDATYIRQGGHHVGHWPTFLVECINLYIFSFFSLFWHILIVHLLQIKVVVTLNELNVPQNMSVLAIIWLDVALQTQKSSKTERESLCIVNFYGQNISDHHVTLNNSRKLKSNVTFTIMGRHKCEAVACLSSQVKCNFMKLLYCAFYLWRINLILIWFEFYGAQGLISTVRAHDYQLGPNLKVQFPHLYFFQFNYWARSAISLAYINTVLKHVPFNKADLRSLDFVIHGYCQTMSAIFLELWLA